MRYLLSSILFVMFFALAALLIAVGLEERAEVATSKNSGRGGIGITAPVFPFQVVGAVGEILRYEEDGDIIYRGQWVANDPELVRLMRDAIEITARNLCEKVEGYLHIQTNMCVGIANCQEPNLPLMVDKPEAHAGVMDGDW